MFWGRDGDSSLSRAMTCAGLNARSCPENGRSLCLALLCLALESPAVSPPLNLDIDIFSIEPTSLPVRSTKSVIMSTDGKDDERALQQVIESLNQMTVQPGEVNARNAMDILKQLLAGDNGDYDDDDEDDSRKEIERLKLLLAEDSDDEDDDEDDDDEDDELGLTPKQREAMERVGRMITGKRKSALLVDIVDFGPFIKRIVAWGFRDRGNDRDAVFMSALDEPDRGFVKTVHPSFGKFGADP